MVLCSVACNVYIVWLLYSRWKDLFDMYVCVYVRTYAMLHLLQTDVESAINVLKTSFSSRVTWQWDSTPVYACIVCHLMCMVYNTYIHTYIHTYMHL